MYNQEQILKRGQEYADELFTYFKEGSGQPMRISSERFFDILSYATADRGVGQPISYEINDRTYTAQIYSFYGTPYERSLGNATIFYNPAGQAVGFYDYYDFNPTSYRPTWLELLTTLGRNTQGRGYRIFHGTYARRQ